MFQLQSSVMFLALTSRLVISSSRWMAAAICAPVTRLGSTPASAVPAAQAHVRLCLRSSGGAAGGVNV
jgi:hypothetical protein